MRMKWILPFVAGVVLIAGCGQDKKKQMTAKEHAQANWNGARANVLTSLAQDQYKAGNFDKARQTVDEATKLTPNAVPLRLLSAKLAIEQGQLERADQELAIARNLKPDDGESFYLSGVVAQRWQKEAAAYDYYSRAVEKSPSELAYLMAESEMLVALDRTDDALRLLQGKIVFFEHSAGIRDAAARLLVQKGRYREAVDLFRQATILTPEENSFREGLGMALYYAKQYKEAVDVLGRLVAIEEFTERADLRLALGESQLQTGKFREARENLETAARVQPGNAGVWLALARAALECNDLKRADTSVKKALALKPESAEAYLLLGYVRLREQKLQDSLSAFNKASAIDRADPVAICMIGFVYEQLGRKDTAVQCYAKALKLKPNDETASKLMAGINLND